MRVLIVGSGGREHALAWKIGQSPLVDKIFVAPGNGGTAQIAENVTIKDDDIQGLVDFARDNKIDLVIPGPELPLNLGITDAMAQAGIPCFGPDRFCARLEGSKAFAKEIMDQGKVPTGKYAYFTEHGPALAYLENHPFPLVVKADGLAAGKGVIICQNMEDAKQSLDEMFVQKKFGISGQAVIIEEFLVGEEVSLLCLCDGKTALPLPSAQDHKAVFDNDQGPNTGGMGAYSPAPVLPDADLAAMTALAVTPILEQMTALGHPFTGVLYAGLIMTADGPKVLEYNTRFGDPECQPLLMRLDNDLTDLLLAACRGELDSVELRIKPEAALGVVIAAAGYPEAYPKGMEISGLDQADALGEVKVFQAGTKLADGKLRSSGGRVLCVTALGKDLASAQAKAYQAVALVKMDNAHYRKDIGSKGLRKRG